MLNWKYYNLDALRCNGKARDVLEVE